MSLSRDTDKMATSETLMIPLRKSEEYRAQEKLDLSWLSRRWIYNVPKSLQTEGLRPLGRLAFADHFESICDCISQKIASAVAEENVATTVESVGLNPPKVIKPRVFIVTSASGGLGSGMALDLAYTVRLMLAENGITQSNLIGVLLQSTEGGRDRGLMNANMFAFLTELRHYTDHGYPGDVRLGIPEFTEELPFDHSYFLRHADKVDGSSKRRFNTNSIAEYICLNTTSKCLDFFEACRQLDEEREELSLRTFGLSISGPTNQINSRESVQKLAKHLTMKWVSQQPKNSIDVNEFVEGMLAKNELDLLSVSKKLVLKTSKLEAYPSTEAEIQKAIEAVGSTTDSDVCRIVENHFDNVFELPAYRSKDQSLDTILGCQSAAIISHNAQAIGDAFSIEIQELLQRSEVSFPLVFSVIDAASAELDNRRKITEQAISAMAQQLEGLKQEYIDRLFANKEEPIPVEDFASKYGQVRFQEFILRCCLKYLRSVNSKLGSVTELAKKYVLQVQLISSEFQDTSLNEDELQLPEYGATIEELMIRSAENNYEDMVRQVEIIVLDQLKAEREGFLEVMSDPVCWQNLLPNAIRDASQTVLSNAFKKISIDRVLSENNIEKPMVVSSLGEQLKHAQPSIADCGGASRLLVGLPRLAEESNLPKLIADEFDVKPCSINRTVGDLVVCCETDQILLANLAFSILKASPEITELANRIATRNDIEWSSLKDLI